MNLCPSDHVQHIVVGRVLLLYFVLKLQDNIVEARGYPLRESAPPQSEARALMAEGSNCESVMSPSFP